MNLGSFKDMTVKNRTARYLAAVTGAALVSTFLLSASAASAADMIRVRGTVVSLSDTTLVGKTREGPDQSIMLKPDWQISGVTKASADDIKAGDYVGIASMPTAEGGAGALEVLIFPAGMKGVGEGSYPWDLKPNSSMTNATVADAVESVEGRTVTVKFQGQEKKIAIPDATPIVTFAAATKADLKPGATVFVPSEKAADGTVSTGRVVVGTNGVVPPM